MDLPTNSPFEVRLKGRARPRTCGPQTPAHTPASPGKVLITFSSRSPLAQFRLPDSHPLLFFFGKAFLGKISGHFCGENKMSRVIAFFEIACNLNFSIFMHLKFSFSSIGQPKNLCHPCQNSSNIPPKSNRRKAETKDSLPNARFLCERCQQQSELARPSLSQQSANKTPALQPWRLLERRRG